MNGAIYMADVVGGQKPACSSINAEPCFAAKLAKGARVLDVFSHVGGFILAALAGGAAHATAVDGSALRWISRPKVAAMGRSEDFATRQGDAFAVMEAMAEEGAQFDVVVCDPPAFPLPNPRCKRGCAPMSALRVWRRRWSLRGYLFCARARMRQI